MNVILVMSDSLRADHLGCYGATDVRTPNLDKFAEESAVFDRAYIASYPTTPNRLMDRPLHLPVQRMAAFRTE